MHEERVLVHHQIYLCRKLFAPLAKVIFFSMNARGVPGSTEKNPLKRIVKKGMWEGVKRNTDAALVHYPGCLKSLRTGGYKKPIFQQTQIGVDETLFAPSEETRKEVRNELGFNDDFVIGYAGRLVEDKGVDDILEVFLRIAESYENVSLLLVGNGGLREHIQERAREQRVKERIVVTGYVELKRVPRYMNAMDTFVLASKTTPHWIDTFPLVTVQAQAIGVPVVASDSGAIPWQLDATALLFKEGNREELYGALQSMIDDPDLRAEYAKKGRRRSLSYFCHQGMTENFKKIARQIMQEQIEYHASGEEYIQWKAY
jgi:glycosyltransferase involved in cell wall biosynthesis